MRPTEEKAERAEATWWASTRDRAGDSDDTSKLGINAFAGCWLCVAVPDRREGEKRRERADSLLASTPPVGEDDRKEGRSSGAGDFRGDSGGPPFEAGGSILRTKLENLMYSSFLFENDPLNA